MNKNNNLACPWCCDKNTKAWGKPIRGFYSRTCNKCKLIYIRNPYSHKDQKEFYKNYHSQVHCQTADIKLKREKMYQIEFEFLKPFLKKKGKVLDIGCGSGAFLDLFKKNKFKTFGSEIGEEAFLLAKKKHKIKKNLESFQTQKNYFDCVIFRGVIEHMPNPKNALYIASEILKRGGILFITSTPNSQSPACFLFKERWNQHEPEAHLYHFQIKHFKEELFKFNLKIISKRYFYLKTPYSNLIQDTFKIIKKLIFPKNTITSPPFFRTMFSIVFQKG